MLKYERKESDNNKIDGEPTVSQRDEFLEKVHISNFLSFNDVELPLKP